MLCRDDWQIFNDVSGKVPPSSVSNSPKILATYHYRRLESSSTPLREPQSSQHKTCFRLQASSIEGACLGGLIMFCWAPNMSPILTFRPFECVSRSFMGEFCFFFVHPNSVIFNYLGQVLTTWLMSKICRWELPFMSTDSLIPIFFLDGGWSSLRKTSLAG